VLVGEGRAPRSSGAPPDSVQVDHVPLKAIPATHAAEEEAQVDRARLQAIEAAIQSGHWIRSHEGRAAQGLESLCDGRFQVARAWRRRGRRRLHQPTVPRQ